MTLKKGWIGGLVLSMAVMAMTAGGALDVYAAEDPPPQADPAAEAKAKKEAEDKAKTEALEKIRNELNGDNAKDAAVDLEILARKNKGYAEALILLGDIHMEGKGVRPNDSIAWHWYNLAAKSGDPKGLFKTAEMHLNGVGVPRSLNKAAELFESAAEKGHVKAQRMIGMIYAGKFSGKLVNYRKSGEWLSRAAEQGDLESERILNELYKSGYLPSPK